jgi:hypothetical protein
MKLLKTTHKEYLNSVTEDFLMENQCKYSRKGLLSEPKLSRSTNVHQADWTSPTSNSALCSLCFKMEVYNSKTACALEIDEIVLMKAGF